MSTAPAHKPIVHFVGSIPLPDAETVFRTLAAATGPHLKRLPDGETGIRKTWIRFLQQVLADNPAIEVASDVPPFKFTQWDGKLLREIPRLRVKSGARLDPATVKTGYADMAIESWRLFDRRHQVPDLAADPDRADLQQHGADRPARADPGADDAYARRGYGDRAGLAQRPHRAAMGRVPGGHCLGGLLRAGAGRFPEGNDRRADRDR